MRSFSGELPRFRLLKLNRPYLVTEAFLQIQGVVLLQTLDTRWNNKTAASVFAMHQHCYRMFVWGKHTHSLGCCRIFLEMVDQAIISQYKMSVFHSYERPLTKFLGHPSSHARWVFKIPSNLDRLSQIEMCYI